MLAFRGRSFTELSGSVRTAFLKQSEVVSTERWQGVSTARRPDLETRELLNVTVSCDLRGLESLDHWRADIKPNLPWADDHFLERVSRVPLNPPPSWAWWPWAGSAEKFLADKQFNHTYPERYWPRFAGEGDARLGPIQPRQGIRYTYGDLDGVLDLLTAEPHTRQAYLPIFFPEDTGLKPDNGRKPCTLGYHFIMRGQALHVYYPMRSCDFVRHYADDVYLTVRLLLWVLSELRTRDSQWDGVEAGSLTMHMVSCHVFINDYLQWRK